MKKLIFVLTALLSGCSYLPKNVRKVAFEDTLKAAETYKTAPCADGYELFEKEIRIRVSELER